jgi:hypothetical protein
LAGSGHERTPWALAHLGLARAYSVPGDGDKAQASYQDFLTLWKDADPDIPILKQAKAEYGRCKRNNQIEDSVARASSDVALFGQRHHVRVIDNLALRRMMA